MKKIFWVVLILLISNSSWASITVDDFVSCKNIKNDVFRLNCFDNLLKKYELKNKTKNEKNNKNDNIILKIEKNTIDDSIDWVSLIIESETDNSVNIVIECTKNRETKLIIDWGVEFFDDSIAHIYPKEKNIIYRIGENQPKRDSWNLSIGATSTYHPESIKLLKEMLKADKFFIRNETNVKGINDINATFDTSGLEEEIKPLRDTCGW